MGLFNSESKEEKAAKKQARKEQKDLEMLQKYRLEALRNPDDIESVRDILFELQSIGWMNFGGISERDVPKIQACYQRALIEQNFIIIRQLDRIAKLLDDK